MPREARIKDDYGIYYVSQLGSSERNLFENTEDRNKFLSILLAAKEKNDLKIYAYCISKSNEYHLVINAQGSDISKVMKGINISYALYVNSSSNIYKDRFKSVLIKDRDTLLATLTKIHNEGKKSKSVYNSFCLYNEKDLTDSGLLDSNDIKLLDTKENCFDQNTNCKDCIKTLDQAISKLQELSIRQGLTVDQLIKNKSIRNELIKRFRRNSTLSLKELGALFGGLSESSICKILNSS